MGSVSTRQRHSGMTSQSVRTSKPSTTFRTLVGPLASMELEMSLEIMNSSKL